MKIIGLFSSLLLVINLISCHSCSQRHSLESKNKKSLVIGISQEPDSLFAPFREMMASEEVARAGNFTLTIFDSNWKLIPWAATRIPTLDNKELEFFTENGLPKMRATWHIRDEFNWADGHPLTADDFVFAWQLWQDPRVEVMDRSVTEKIEKMESRGPKTLVVTWKEPYAYYHNYRQHEAIPKHVVEPVYQQNPESLKRQTFVQKPLYAGAFTIKEWVPGSHIIAVRNPYAKGFLRPYLDEIIWKIIPQNNTLESNLVANNISAISTVGLEFAQALQLEERHKSDFNFYFTPGLVWEHIDFNLSDPIMQDKRIRQALAYGANREGIAVALSKGKLHAADGTEPPRSFNYNPSVKKYSYRPELANQLLDEAGFKRSSPEGIREKEGRPLHLVFMTTAGNKFREEVQQLLQSQWRQLGIDVEIKNQPAKVFFGNTVKHRNYGQMALFAWIKDPIALSDTLWKCKYIPTKENGYLGQNTTGFCHSKVDEIFEKAQSELNEARRKSYGQEIENILAEELPSLSLFFSVDATVTDKNLLHWKPTGMLQAVSWNANEWRWR